MTVHTRLEQTSVDNTSAITAAIADESVPRTFIRVLGKPYMRATALRCVASIIRNFFLLQYRLSFLPGRVPVTRVDHPLDSRIPFLPRKISTYLDFVAFWIRSIGFLVRNYGRKVYEPARNFLEIMGELYAYAAEVYRKNLSTTDRPFYIGRPRFILIHALDPHLMCIPSLHVMVVICTYTLFRKIIVNLGEEKRLASQAEELRKGALDITEAVLYVKQHSVNCISAAMYAMTRYNPLLFPVSEAERFASCIFREAKNPNEEDGDLIREHILSLYRRFISEGDSAVDWKEPLLNFLKEQPKV